MDKYSIYGLGNPGYEYEGTRYNTRFMVLGAFAKASNVVFEDKRYGSVAETTVRGRKVILLKSTTLMDLSGDAVCYWLNKENIDQNRFLVVPDDVALPLGAFHLKGNGSNDDYNGLGHIQQPTGQNYAHLRTGVDNNYPRGGQIDWVPGRYSNEKVKEFRPAINLSVDIIRSLAPVGIDITMDQFNKLGKRQPDTLFNTL